MSLLDQNIPELEETLAALGEPKFRAKQLYAWLAAGAAFEEMTNLPKSLREKLRDAQQEGYVEPIEVLKAEDGTRKYLFRLADGNTVESVLMRKNYGNTLCLSTQVGCRMGCAFCASCKNGLIRNLTPGEMLAQFIFANRELGGGRSIKNIVLMGMGEPFDNYDHVAAFLRRVNDANGLGVSWRDISLSTCGLVPQILRFAQENMPVHLCLSLHAPTDEKRRKIMPAAKKWKLEEIISALKTAQAYEFVSKLKNGLDSHVEQGGKNFSGGQRQRLCIARAIVGSPELLILDDSFSALDFTTDAALRKALKQSTTDMTVIIVTQRCSTIKNADLILVLDDGRLVGKGTHDELFENCETYREICLSQLKETEAK